MKELMASGYYWWRCHVFVENIGHFKKFAGDRVWKTMADGAMASKKPDIREGRTSEDVDQLEGDELTIYLRKNCPTAVLGPLAVERGLYSLVDRDKSDVYGDEADLTASSGDEMINDLLLSPPSVQMYKVAGCFSNH